MNLNTSYVEVKHVFLRFLWYNVKDLNTSYVEVKQLGNE